MTAPLRIAFCKPDFGVAGGLESVVAELEGRARSDGHEVTRLSIDMVPPRPEVAGLEIDPQVWASAPEYFTYLAGWDGFARLETGRFDVIVSTQSPSFAVEHPRHLSVFYHHHRVYYDLEDLYVRAGFADDEAVHREAGKLIRDLDQPKLDQVDWFLAGSACVAARLAEFNGCEDASVFQAGLVVGDAPPSSAPTAAAGAVLSVGRHEFPKRTELVVAAAHLLGGQEFCLVGTGGRLEWARALDRRLTTTDTDPTTLTDEQLWCNVGRVDDAEGHGSARASDSNVTFAGRISDEDLAHRYRQAPCVVAPAYQEDYGLTVIEAMAQATPPIVCTDGGGLTELVTHEQTGLVVEPTAAAIAAAVERLTTDPDLAAELGANGRVRAAELSWDRAHDQFRAGLDRVLA